MYIVITIYTTKQAHTSHLIYEGVDGPRGMGKQGGKHMRWYKRVGWRESEGVGTSKRMVGRRKVGVEERRHKHEALKIQWGLQRRKHGGTIYSDKNNANKPGKRREIHETRISSGEGST